MKKYYLFSDTFGLIEYDEIEPGKLYNSGLNKSYLLTEEYSETPDEAKLKHYLKKISYFKEKEESLRKQKEKNDKFLEKLNSKFGYLIDIYPEEFL